MKYKVGDKVRIKSLDWYNKHTNDYGNVVCGNLCFNSCNKHWCGKIVTIETVHRDCYLVKENDAYWNDIMIEGLVEEEVKNWANISIPDDPFTVTYGPPSMNDSMNKNNIDNGIIILPEGYIFKDENGNEILTHKIILEQKKKEYPKTFLECCDVLDIKNLIERGVKGYKAELFDTLQKLYICRDAYWKIAGEEWKLKYPWHPKWDRTDIIHHIITYAAGAVYKDISIQLNYILAFPTEEMRDAFYEAFKEDIEKCKELL